MNWWGADVVGGGRDSDEWARGSRSVSRGELRRTVASEARLLRGYGIGAGSTVAVQGAPSFTQLWTMLALWSLDAQVLLVEPRLRGPALGAQLDHYAPQYYISFGNRSGVVTPFQDECEVTVHPLRGGRPAVTEHCLIQFTSGTTGATKAIGRTARSLSAELAAFAALPLMPSAGERVLVLDPMIHSFGLIGGTLAAMASGAVAVFAGDHRPDRLLACAIDSDVHAVIGNPRHFAHFGAVPERPPLPSLRLAVSSGEPLPHVVAARFEHRYGLAIGQAYGTTETGIIATDLAGEYGPGTVGRPAPGVDVRLKDGRVQVRVDADPYLHVPSLSVVDGWLGTNDLGSIDEAGVLRLRGRISAAAATPDPDLNLVELEAVLHEHRHITDAVVLLEDVIEAHVSGPESLRLPELTSWARDRLGARHLPRRFNQLPEIPRTLSGKLVRNRKMLVPQDWDPHRW